MFVVSRNPLFSGFVVELTITALFPTKLGNVKSALDVKLLTYGNCEYIGIFNKTNNTKKKLKSKVFFIGRMKFRGYLIISLVIYLNKINIVDFETNIINYLKTLTKCVCVVVRINKISIFLI